MRKILVILALTVATVAASAGDAFSQGLFRGRRMGVGYGQGYYGNGYYNNGIYGNGYYGNGFYGPGYSSTGFYNSAPNYNGAQYYSSGPIMQTPGSQIRQSSYSGPIMSQQVASVMVQVPRTDAKVWFDGTLTSQQGMERAFHSPPLDPGSTYTYTVRSSWMENGKSVERERTVNVQPGQTVTVDLRNPSTEALQTSPRPQ